MSTTRSSASTPMPTPQPQPGPSRIAPPPQCMKREELTPEDQVRMPASRHSGVFGFLHHHTSRQEGLNQLREQQAEEAIRAEDAETERLSDETDSVPFVRLENRLVYSADLEEDYSKDVYRWAVLYENQRGITMFSTAYYSRLSLLPIDPPAFTIPSASKTTRRHHPSVSLRSFPLPDGDWRWVSRMWLVDMRGDGQAQYDGFEYNWYFRQTHWRPQVGMGSAGGWVRRRRWVRLMMRPAASHAEPSQAPSGTQTPQGMIEEVLQLQHHEAGATRPPSILPPPQEEDDDYINVWQGDSDDWQRCRRALLHLDRDGRKLELWERWLRPRESSQGSSRGRGKEKTLPQKQWTEDDRLLPSQHARLTTSTVDGMLAADTGVVVDPAPREHMSSILRDHGSEVLQMFKYPDSRTRFLELLGNKGLLSELSAGSGLPIHNLVEFWSSSQSLQSYLPANSSSDVMIDSH